MKKTQVLLITFLLIVSTFPSFVQKAHSAGSPEPHVTASSSYVKAQTSSFLSVDFELRNIGDPSSSDSFLSVSASNGLKISSYSVTPHLADIIFSHYYPGDLIWHSDGSQKMAFYELVDVHGHPYSRGELVTITIVFKAPDWASAHWIKYRAAMLPQGVNYPTDVPPERDPDEASEIDQQGYPAYTTYVEVSGPEGEWFAQVRHEPFDSDGDGNNDAVRIGMNADTVGGTATVHVYNSMYRNFGAHGFVDDDTQKWEIAGTSVEWKYSFLYVSLSHPYGNYEVILHLYDEANNLEDSYTFYVDLYPGEANPRKWIQDVEIEYLEYDATGPLPTEWPNVVKIRINADTEGGEEEVEVYGNLTDDAGKVLDYSGTGTWTIHGTEVEWERFYLWLDPPNPPGYYWVKMELYTAVRPWSLEDTMEIRVGPLYQTGYTPPDFELAVSAEIAAPSVLGEVVALDITLKNTGTMPTVAGDYATTVTFWDYYDRPKGGIDSFWVKAKGFFGISESPVRLGPTPTPQIESVPVLNPGDSYVLQNVQVPFPDDQGPSLILADTIRVEVSSPDAVSGYCEIQDFLAELSMMTYYEGISQLTSMAVGGILLDIALAGVDIVIKAVENSQVEFDSMVESFAAGDLKSAAKHCALMAIEMCNWYMNMPLEDRLDLLKSFIGWNAGIAIANMLVWWYNFKATCQENGFDLSSLSPSVILGVVTGLILWTDPVNLSIIDPLDRRVGAFVDPEIGTMTINESPNAYIVEVNGNLEAVFFPELIEGTYKVNYTGVEQADFTLRVEAFDESSPICNETFTSLINIGEVLTSEVKVTKVSENFEAIATEPRHTGLPIAVVRGMDNRIYYRAWSGTGSGGWIALPGSTTDSPAAAVCKNELHIVVRGSDGRSLWHGYVDLADNTFIGWTRLSGWTPSAPTLTSNGTVLCLVVRGGDNRIYYRIYSCGSRVWGGWNALPTGSTCNGPAAAMLGNDLHIVVRGFSATNVYGNYSLWHVIVNPNVGVVRGWVGMSGYTSSKPSLAANQTSNKLYLAVRGLDNRIYWRTYVAPTDSWESWNMMPTGSTCDGPAATVADNKLHVVVRGSDGSTLWHRYYDFSTATYSDWTKLSGSTPSPPTLTG